MAQSVTGSTATGAKLPCMGDDCQWSAWVWLMREEGAGVDANGQLHGSRQVNVHVCSDCRDEMVKEGWKVKRW